MPRLIALDDLGMESLRGKRVLVRVDFNVPLDGMQVRDATRLEEARPTLDALAGAGAKVILASHRGRPGGDPDEALSLRPVAEHLATMLNRPVRFAEDCIGPTAQAAVDSLEPGATVMLENLRFHAGEKANDESFAQGLAALADIFVGNAFGTAHRTHASVVGVANRVTAKAAGHLLVREVEVLSTLLGEPARPFVGILGGAKVSGKIDTLQNLLPRLNVLLVGGGMANTFLAARGFDMAHSLVETDRIAVAAEILERATALGVQVLLPEDLVITDDLGNPGTVETVAVDAVTAGTMAVDIGPKTRASFATACASAATLFWNGPLGVFEKPPFDAGTQAVATGLGTCKGFSVIGGGETVAAVRGAGLADRVGHVSTGGGASLALLAGKVLPGVAILEKPS